MTALPSTRVQLAVCSRVTLISGNFSLITFLIPSVRAMVALLAHQDDDISLAAEFYSELLRRIICVLLYPFSLILPGVFGEITEWRNATLQHCS